MEGTTPPARSNSYRYPGENRARDDSYVVHGHPHRTLRQGSFTEKDYGSRSDSYTSMVHRHDSFTSPLGFINDSISNEFHEQIYNPSVVNTHEQECLAFSQDIVNQQGNISPIPHKPKPRSFPRTNPAYVGVPKRNGNTTYKRLNVDQQPVNYDLSLSGELSTYGVSGVQVSPRDYYVENYYYPHERSDSDTSHSSTRAMKHERTDSRASHSSKHSDSQSSQGSLRNMSTEMHSSHSSLRNQPHHQQQDSITSFPESVSSRGSGRSSGGNQDHVILRRSGSQVSHNSLRASDNSESEPDYANVPTKDNSSYSSYGDSNHYKEILRERQNIINNQESGNYVQHVPPSGSIHQQLQEHIQMSRGHRSLPVMTNYPPEGKSLFIL